MALAAEADFGLSLLREVSFNSTTALSPISIALALSLVHLGAKGKSKEEIKNVICKGSTHEDCENHFSFTLKSIINRAHPYYKNWMYCNKAGNILCVEENQRELYIKYNWPIPADYPLQRTGVLVNIANRIFVGNHVNVKQSYQEEVSSKYEARLQSLDFSDKAGAARVVNKFVEDQTMGKINKLVTDESFSDDTKALLANAVYFHGRWKETFDYSTKEDEFHVNERETKQVTYMKHVKEDFPFYQNDEFMVLSLPYKAENVAFTIILPKKSSSQTQHFYGGDNTFNKLIGSILFFSPLAEQTGSRLDQPRHGDDAFMIALKLPARFGLTSVLENLTGENLQQLVSSQKYHLLNVTMPKFKLESEAHLAGILKKMGIVDPFTEKADLSGITEDHLVLSEAKHKVTIDVNEKGSTAAASTAIEAVEISLLLRSFTPEPINFVADHPFFFFINHGGHILFTGQYYG